MGSCRGKMESLEVACKDTMIPIEVESVQEFLNKFKQLRIDVLTTVMSALKEGNDLLAQLQDIVKSGTLDSRPGHIKRDAMRAINQVQQWLENLHDRRNLLEGAWQTRKSQLEQCLALAILAKDLNELEQSLFNEKRKSSGMFSLGECENTSNKILQQYFELKHDALLFRDRALKITRATEKLVSSGGFAGDEACTRAYNVLSNCTDYLELIDQRVHWLQQSKEFFIKSEKTLSVFERLEIELATITVPANTPEAFALFSKILKDVKAFTEEPLRVGYGILDEVGRTAIETQGVKRVLDEIENRKVYIEGICSDNTEAQIKVTEALNNFLEKYNQILSWLVSVAEAFLKANNTMGTSLDEAKSFLLLHHQIMQDLEFKGENINDLLTQIKDYLTSLDAQQRYDVDTKAESLHKHWIELKELIIRRVDLASLHVEFYEKARNLCNMFENMERTLDETPHENKLKLLEDNWSDIKNHYGNLKATGMKFLNTKVADPYLETKNACSSVEEILNSFSNRQLDITTSWKNWTTSVTEKQEIEIILEKIMTENIEALNQTTKLDTKLYPIFATLSEDPIKIKDELRDKLQNVLQDIEKAQNEVLQRIETTTAIQSKDIELMEKIEKITSNLKSLKTKLDNIKQDYRLLMEDILHFIENVITLRTVINEHFDAQNQKQLFEENFEETRENNIMKIISDHENFREQTMDKFRILILQSEKLIERVRTLEPLDVREHDTDRILKLLENLRKNFEMNNEVKITELNKLKMNINYKNDLNEINNNLKNVCEQLNDIRAQNIETLTSAKTSSLAFEYYERTIELLEKRIENFKNSSENFWKSNPETESLIRNELNQLQNKWDSFKNEVKSTRNVLNLTTKYFELLEQINNKYRETSSFYANITNKIPTLNTSVEASNLVNDIEKYISTNEILQMENIEKLIKLCTEIKSNQDNIFKNKSEKVKDDNIELFQSFKKLKSDIGSIEERLRNEENKKDQNDDLLLKQKIQNDTHQQQQQKQQQQQQQQGYNNYENNIEEIHHKKTVVNELFTEIKYVRPLFTQRLQDTIINEGDKFTFTCRVIGDPKPNIEWFKDGISIQNNPDYHTTYINDECKLSIDETFTADSARFMCMASNLVGCDETSATLTVKEQSDNNTMILTNDKQQKQQQEQMIPPQITKYLQNGLAREGSSFQFSCSCTGNPLPTVQWYKDNICIDDIPDYVILYNNGEAILRFDQVFLEDHAIYTCKFTNPIGFEQCSAKLTVEPLEPTEIPSFKLPLSNVMARVGQKIKLECIVAGLPRPEVFWTHNGKPFIGRDAKYEDDRVTLIISEAYPKDSGLYVVTAKNLAGEAYSSCNVSVKGRLPNETSDSEIASDMEPIKPSVQLPLKNISIFEGKSVRLDCVIIGQPEPEVIWYHNDRPVKESSDIQLLFQGDRCSLIIQEAYLEDAGSYKVVAINSAGEASSSCTLSVTPLNISEPATRQQNEKRISNELPPKFEKFLTDVLAAEGETVELECAVAGIGPFTSKWYLSNKELNFTERVKQIEESNGVFKLVINSVTAEDKGVYTVKVSNNSGDAKCFSHLIVKSVNAQEALKHQPEIEEKSICPTFKELFSDQNAKEEQSVKFECLVLGKPTPKIKWLFNDQPVHGKNFLVSTSGNRQVLTVPIASSETVGKIACTAENEVGKATCVAYLNLIREGQQSPLSSMNIQNISEEHNTDSSIVTIKKQIFTSSQSTSQTNTVEGTIPHKIDSEFSRIETELNQKPVEITYKPQTPTKTGRKHIAPKFINPLVGKIVDQGSTVILEAVYDAFPSPEIKVKKNGEVIFDSDRIKISNKFNKISIDLLNVGVRDAGRYSITASNSAGTSTSTADIVVKKTIFPPVFGHRLQAQVVKRGERVIMEVEVTGTPIPTVTWYKDNKPIKDVLKSEFKIKNEGNTYTLTIDKVQTQDSGKFMVKAINDGGESQSIADFAVLEPTPERMIEVLKTTVYDDLKDFKENTLKPEEKSFHNVQEESKCEIDSHSTTESKVFTEHRCITEATMRLEHKTNYIDLPPLRTPTPKQKLFTESLKPSSTTPVTPIKSSLYDSSEDSAIETSSISKKSAFEYFKRIQSEQPVEAEQKYMKYDNVAKPENELKFMPINQYKETITNEHCVENFSSSDVSQFKLKPGTPPEICYIPKPEFPPKTQISQRIKKLESQKFGSEPPAGGVSVLPKISSKEEFSKTSYIKEFKAESASIPPIFRPQAVLSLPQTNIERPQSPKPSAEGVAMEKLWASPKPNENEPLFKPNTISPDTQHVRYTPFSESEAEVQFIDEHPKMQSIKETKEMFEKKIIEQQTKSWAPSTATAVELKSPNLVIQSQSKQESINRVQTPIIEVQLEPGTPPEICFAPIPERRQSLKEVIEQNLENDLLKEPSKVLPCSVRTMPPIKKDLISNVPSNISQNAQASMQSKPLFNEKSESFFEQSKQTSEKVIKPSSPFIPPKFVKNEIYESDYEVEKIKFSGSESDEPGFRSVKPPSFLGQRPKSTEPTPLAPSQFEIPFSESNLKPRPKSGYIADTEEMAVHKYESRSVKESKQFFESRQLKQEFISSPISTSKIFKSSTPITSPIQESQASLTKDISMMTKQVRINQSPSIHTTAKVSYPSSPSKFTKTDFHESDYGSDFDDKIRPIWKPYNTTNETKCYRPIHPSLTPSGRSSNLSEGVKSPIPPSEFDNMPKFEIRPRQKFEPVKKEEPIKSQPQSYVFKPKPVSAKYIEKTSSSHQPSYTTRYYTAVAGTPFHNASVATETKNAMQMKESSEKCHRVVNMSQTKRIIHFDNNKANQEDVLEPFPFAPISGNTSSPKRRCQPPPTPTKFIPGEFRESDYESEVENARIRPLWTPNPSDSDEPRYRHVNPPRPARATSLPRTYGRVMSPLDFDHYPQETPTKVSSSHYSHYSHESDSYLSQNIRTTRDDMNLRVGSPPKYGYIPENVHSQVKDISSSIHKKTNQFMNDVSKDLKTSTYSFRPGFKRAPSEGSNQPQIYRDESRMSQYGTKHIDPNTGLIYFKYDFGYEFGIIFPGEGKKFIGSSNFPSSNSPNFKSYINSNIKQKSNPIRSGYTGDIIIPVKHERTTPLINSNDFKYQNGITSDKKNYCNGYTRKKFNTPIEINIDDFHKDDRHQKIFPIMTETTANDVPVNAHLIRENRPMKAPMFITPLKDIAVVIGQTARFECIVQSEPHPETTWSKNGLPLKSSNKHIIEFRNGVCRLTIPEAYSDDAGTYTCTGTNQLGSASTTAELLVPRNRCGIRN